MVLFSTLCKAIITKRNELPMKVPTPLERAKLLEATRLRKMARDSHAYVRGSTARYYEWLAAGPKIPVGPSVWICGDCHISNLGPVAASDGSVTVKDDEERIFKLPFGGIAKAKLDPEVNI